MDTKGIAVIGIAGVSAGLLAWYLTQNKEKTVVVTGVAVIGGILVQGLR